MSHMNESKISDPRMWKRWGEAGALSGIEEAKLAEARALGPLPVMGLGKHFDGPAAGKTTASLGEKIVAEGVIDGTRWRSTEPIICAVINGHGHRLDVPMRLPRNAKPLSRFFPNLKT